MQVKELGHLVLYVRDLATSVHFYRDVLGWRMLGDDRRSLPGGGVLLAVNLRTHHELLLIEVGPDAASLPPGRRVGLYHFGLKVGDSDDELRAALATLEENGVTVLGASDHTVTHSLYIADPDGNEIELYIDVPGVDWRNDPMLMMSPIKPLRALTGRRRPGALTPRQADRPPAVTLRVARAGPQPAHCLHDRAHPHLPLDRRQAATAPSPSAPATCSTPRRAR